MNHTPGPWTVGVYDATENFRSITHHACVCDPDTMALIAVTGPATDEQSQHDARLIAAAPDMQEALEYIAAHAEMATTLANDYGRLVALDNVMTRARAALAALEPEE